MQTVHRRVYPNGLTLLFIETHQAPVVSINICVRVGSRYESDEEAGICHLIEHMLFKGTAQMGPGEVAKRIEASGGDVNAYTSFDETVYYGTLASRYFETGMRTLSDAVLNSIFDPEELSREKEVVIEEILRSKDSPNKVLSEAVFEKAFPTHHYGRPIIGFKETVQNFSREKILNFYRSWYVPENLVVAVAGDFSFEHATRLCDELFSNLPSVNSPRENKKIGVSQAQTQAIALANPIQGSTAMMAYHIPALDGLDIPALDILSHILGEGESSRLELVTKEKLGLVNSIYSYVYSPQDPGLFTIAYTLPEKNIPKATRSVFEQIIAMQEGKLDHDDLARAKINIKSDAVYEKETVEGLARKFGYFETILRKFDFDEHYYQRIDSVTKDDVVAVAQKYLHPQNLTLGLIHPKSSRKKWQASDLLELAKPARQKSIKKKKKEDIQYLRLSNGLRLILRENHHVPTLVIRSAHIGGLRAETPQNNGIHTLLTQLWGKSTQSLSSEEMAREVEMIAGSIESYNGRNLSGMKADFLSEKLYEGIHLFLEALLKPRFARNDIEREKHNILEAIRREEDDLASLAFKQFMRKLYPKHPYGLPLLGEAKNIRRFGNAELEKTYRRLLNPKEMVISIVGDFDTENLLQRIRKPLESLQPRPNKIKPLKVDPAPKSIQRIERVMDKFQAHLVLGFQGVSLYDRDRYALDVLNNVLAGQGGRLFLELRDKMSLAYSVTSLSQEGVEPGYFGVYIATEPRKINTAIEGILRELDKVRQFKIPAEELDRAKQYMVGAYEIDLQRNSSVATQLAFNEIYGMPRREWRELPKKILRVSSEEVYKVARRILQLERYILSIIHP